MAEGLIFAVKSTPYVCAQAYAQDMKNPDPLEGKGPGTGSIEWSHENSARTTMKKRDNCSRTESQVLIVLRMNWALCQTICISRAFHFVRASRICGIYLY